MFEIQFSVKCLTKLAIKGKKQISPVSRVNLLIRKTVQKRSVSDQNLVNFLIAISSSDISIQPPEAPDQEGVFIMHYLQKRFEQLILEEHFSRIIKGVKSLFSRARINGPMKKDAIDPTRYNLRLSASQVFPEQLVKRNKNNFSF